MADYDFPGKVVTLSGDDLKKMKPGPIRWAGLDPVLIAWGADYLAALAIIYARHSSSGRSGSCRDYDPVSEMLIWEAIRLACDTYTASHPKSDRHATVLKLSCISMYGEFHRETDATREFRCLLKTIWSGLAKDRVATMNEIMRSLGVIDSNA